jgi:hypothetical protein
VHSNTSIDHNTPQFLTATDECVYNIQAEHVAISVDNVLGRLLRRAISSSSLVTLGLVLDFFVQRVLQRIVFSPRV